MHTGQDLLAIDLGGFMLPWANAHAGLTHRLWAAHPVTKAGLRALEFSHA